MRGVPGFLGNRIQIVDLDGTCKNDGIDAALRERIEQILQRLRIRGQSPSVSGDFTHRRSPSLESVAQRLIGYAIALYQDRGPCHCYVGQCRQNSIGCKGRGRANVDSHLSRIQFADRFRPSDHDDGSGQKTLQIRR
jgi:hypothetical protein